MFARYSNDGLKVSLIEFKRFLKEEQGDANALSPDNGGDGDHVARRIVEYLQDPSRHVQQPYFTSAEFMDYLFSKENQVRYFISRL